MSTVTQTSTQTIVMAEGLNPRAYGALGDGVTDDTAAFIACLAAAQSSGARVFIPEGVYIIDGLTIPDGLCMVGAGVKTVLKLKAGSVNAILAANPRNDLILSDFCVDGNKANQTSGNFGVFIGGASARCTIQRLHVRNTYGHGILINNCTGPIFVYDNHVYGCGVENTHRGIYIYGSSKVNCCRNSVYDASGFCMTVDGSQDVLVSENIIHGAVGYDALIVHTSPRVRTVNNVLTDAADSGIVYELSDDGIITGNHVRDINYVGVYLAGCNNCIVAHNELKNCGRAADDTYNSITIQTSGTTHSTNNIVAGNVLLADATNRPKIGVCEVDASQDYNRIEGNVVRGHRGADTQLMGTNTKLLSLDDSAFRPRDVVTISASATLAAADLVDGSIFDITGTASHTLTLDTGANITLAVPGAAAGMSFQVIVKNSSTVTQSLTPNTGVVFSSPTSVPSHQVRTFTLVCIAADSWVLY